MIDWFCGLGNFTLPRAHRRARGALGLEGSEALVQRSRENAARNGLDAVASFAARNLFELPPDDLVAGPADRWLVDPPPEGRVRARQALAELHADRRSRRAGSHRNGIVYVS